MAIACGMLAATSCTDYIDYNTVPEAIDPAADKTLWENISANDNLSDFASVLQRVGYDKVLNTPGAYTVWAPINGSFDMDSLSQVSDTKVEKEFLRNVIASYTHRENDLNDTIVYMLNGKLLKFSNKNTPALSFDGQSILPNSINPAVFNYPSVNGLLYNVAVPAAFRYNGYEYISEAADIANSMATYVKKYETIILDEASSIKGDIIDGVQHYDDSVVIVTNTLIEDNLRSQINNEDSTYTVLIPTDEAWEEAYKRISSYYKYIPKIAYQDLQSPAVGTNKGTTGTIMKADLGKVETTLSSAPAGSEFSTAESYWTDSITKRWITNNLIFSETNRKYNSKLITGMSFAENDTLYSTTRSYLTNPTLLDEATIERIKLSNGHARIINRLPFTPEDTYAPIIRTSNVGRIVTATGSGYTYERIHKVNLDPKVCVLEEGYPYLTYVKADIPSASNFAAELDFYLNDVLSTTYDIYAVIVPARVEDPTTPDSVCKPYTLYFDINYTDASNTQITGRFDGDTIQVGTAKVKKVEPFLVGDLKVDTVKLGRITFPICYAGTEAKPNIKVMHSVNSFLSSYKKKYEQVLRVANIILEPVAMEEDE